MNPTMRRTVSSLLAVVAGVAWIPLARGTAFGDPLNVFVGTNLHFSSFYVAEKLDLFRRHGVEVKVTAFPTGTAASQAFQAGRGELVGAGDLPSIRLWHQKQGVGIAPFLNVCKMQVVVGQTSLKSAADLKGKTVGVIVGSTSEFFLQKYLDTAGLTVKDVTVKNLPPADLVVALTRGDIDAFVWAEPWGIQAVQVAQGRAHILTYGCGYFTEYMVLNASKQAIESRGEDLGRVLRALREAGAYIVENRGAASRIVAERLKLDTSLVSDLLGRFSWSLAYSKTFRKDMNALASFMVDTKTLDGPIDWSVMFEPRFLRAIDPALVEN